MKKSNKIITVLVSIVCGIVLCLGIFLGIDYFSSGKTSVKKTEQQEKESDDSSSKNKISDEEKYRANDKDEEKNTTSKKSSDSKTQVTKVTEEKVKEEARDTNKKEEPSQLVPRSYTYNGKKLSPIAGIGNTGKVFTTQNEALKYGQEEIDRLVAKDKKSRQFGVGRVLYEDGTLAGWSVEIYESNNN